MKSSATLPTPHQLERDTYYKAARLDFSKRYKTFDSLSMEVLFSLLQTFLSCGSKMAGRLMKYGLTPSGLNTLCILLSHGKAGCPLNQLSRLLLVTRANITGLVDGLVRRGLVKREDHPEDRRIVLAKLTPKGEQWLNDYLPDHYKRIRERFSCLSVSEKQTLLKLLHKLRLSYGTPTLLEETVE